MKVTLGGDRVGSGNKMQLYLHNYYRSTHNLSQKWASSMASGVLYPFLVLPAMRGDKFEINLEAACRTIPTKGPLFGSYKMQLDIYQVPIRLYQALLHNNPTSIGLKMNQVKFPTLTIGTYNNSTADKSAGCKINNSALLKYLGLSGIGHNSLENNSVMARTINAIPALGYYEIFKTYYSNKQEEDAYVIGVKTAPAPTISINTTNEIFFLNSWELVGYDENYYQLKPIGNHTYRVITIYAPKGMKVTDFESALEFTIRDDEGTDLDEITLTESITAGWAERFGTPAIINENTIAYSYAIYWDRLLVSENDAYFISINRHIYENSNNALQLLPFKLSNIDDMRMKLLSFHEFGSAFNLSINGSSSNSAQWGLQDGTDHTGLPYSTLFNKDSNNETHNGYPLNGLMIKTYQSDIYNNWIRTEWIDGANGIATLTAVSTVGGSFRIDTLNMAEKLYDLYNRIAVSDNTYEGWQDAVYTELPKLHIETPVYLGGMSNEVVFEEIIQTAPANEGSEKGLGTLGGRGTLIKRKGGNVHVKIAEASFIIGIVSLTPRIYYTQGNEFYLTDMFSVDDFHKPALDGIGFQNLIGERIAWWDTAISVGSVVNRSKIGKIPAWLEYMTAVDKAYGDFADDERGEDGANFMILSRRYEQNSNGTQIADASTYVDPQKFNYAFAYTQLDAQNFWVQINSTIIARRLMSAKQIPNI